MSRQLRHRTIVETGGLLLTPLPGAMALKLGSVAKPFFGVVPAIVDEKGNILKGAAQRGQGWRARGPGGVLKTC
jgi:acyl-coenzyme A synthetase/AMP-(fatty) acid ligase